jgi:hypothetical protein
LSVLDKSARRRLREAQRSLVREQEAAKTRDLGRGFGIGR